MTDKQRTVQCGMDDDKDRGPPTWGASGVQERDEVRGEGFPGRLVSEA